MDHPLYLQRESYDVTWNVLSSSEEYQPIKGDQLTG